MQIRVSKPFPDTEFWTRYLDHSSGILRWDDLDAFWPRLKASGGEWYVFEPDEDAPETPVSGHAWQAAVQAARTLVDTRRDMSVSGAVYVDDRETPAFIKVFDPSHMGSSCSHSGAPVMPRFIFSRIKPDSLPSAPPEKGFLARLRGRA